MREFFYFLVNDKAKVKQNVSSGTDTQFFFYKERQKLKFRLSRNLMFLIFWPFVPVKDFISKQSRQITQRFTRKI